MPLKKHIYGMAALLAAVFILQTSALLAADATIILGGTPPHQLRVVVRSGGVYCVYRYDNGLWMNQFYSTNTPIFSIKIGTTVFTSNTTGLTAEDVSAVTTGQQQQVTKRFSGAYLGRPFSVLLTIHYNTSNPDYITQSAVVDASNIAAGTPISLAYGFDAYVNGCDGGAAITVPDLGYNNYLNPAGITVHLTPAQVQSLRLAGGINTLLSGSLIGFFTLGRPFDRAISSYYGYTYCYDVIQTTRNNEFFFGPYNVPSCQGMSDWDNGVGVAYDNIPPRAITTIRTGLTFTTDLDGELDYEWNHSKNLLAAIGDPVNLDLTYISYNTVPMNNVGFHIDLPALSINGACSQNGFLSGAFTGNVGDSFYKVANAAINAFDTAYMTVPVNTQQCGQWVIDADAISEMSRTLPLGTPATLTVQSSVNFASADTVRACRGDSVLLTVKLPDGVTSSQSFTVSFAYTGTTASFLSLPASLPFPAGTNSISLGLQTLPYAPVNTALDVTITGTDQPFVVVGAPASVHLSVNPPNPLLTDDVVACRNATATITAVSDDPTALLVWYSDAACAHVIDTTPAFDIVVVSDTLFYVVSVSNNSCRSADSVKVSVRPQPVLTVANRSVCSGAGLTLTASTADGSDTLYWYRDRQCMQPLVQSSSYTAASITSDTTFYVEAISKDGCSAYDSVKVSLLSQPVLTTQPFATCVGSTVDVTASTLHAADILYWYRDRLCTQLIVQAGSFTAAGIVSDTMFYVKALSQDGCSAYDSVKVTVLSQPVLTTADVAVCAGSTAAIAAASLHAADILYWYRDRLCTQLIVQAGSFTAAGIVSDTMFYVKALSQDGCSAYDSVKVSLLSQPVLTTQPFATCAGSTVDVSASTLQASDTLHWYRDRLCTQLIVQAGSFTATVGAADTLFYVKAVSQDGCSAYDSVKVSVVAYPELTADDVSICSGTAATVVATANQNASLQWFLDALYSQPAAAAGTFVTVPLTAHTVFYVEAVNATGCRTRGSATVRVTLPPSVLAMDDVRICYGDEISLSVRQYDGTVSWNIEPTTVRPLTTTEYVVTASRPPCPDVHDAVVVTVNDSLYIEPATLPFYKRNELYSQALYTNAADPLYTFTAGQLPPGIAFNPNGTFYGTPPAEEQDGVPYLFTVRVTDRYGCTAERQYGLKEMLFIPEVFSPNGDGINDHFMKGFKVVIFDRLGRKIFEGNDGWGGTYHGKEAPEDTYFYIVSYTEDYREIRQTGFIAILK